MRRLSGLVAVVLALAGCGAAAKHAATPSTTPVPSGAASTPATTSATSPPVRPARRRTLHPKHRQHARHARVSHPAHRRASSRSKTRPQTATAPPKKTVTYTATLALHAGGSGEFTACGARRHYRTYATGTPIKFSGNVRPIPSGTWKVKLKIKICRGGSFTDYLKFDASRDKHHGTFGGSFQAPGPGDYEVRSELYLAGTQTTRSAYVRFATL